MEELETYYKEQIKLMKRRGFSEEEIKERLESALRLQELVVKVTA